MNRDRRKKHQVKNKDKQIDNHGLKKMRQEIEDLRDELNKKTLANDKGISNQETLELSQKLDQLITKYLKNL
ncbi:aspartyl-phosphate phosphatase Spo0E family protein [Irregularibacter muris]|uniref:Aspartyl-phosphate phosphatase Spo0E family protein n=1 Tax=Irregularibacter muris TaxID=1796619 RepID=A0AAE3HG33_9FIRM|nr:aspartyl-phosphate phosphatase Spo0E family protein [Irregularibacter muris]MCR1899976.1 aspartyl-phosphate phosphatase Spo0E family protein [Irregularibacter muris]